MARKRRTFGRNPTLATVAERAGVSPMTVSNVLNNRPNVTQAKREAVQQAVRALGYRPNRAARSLASASHYRIGLLYSENDSSFLAQILLGSLRAVNLQNAEIALWGFRPNEEGSALAAAKNLIESGIDGLILPPPLCEHPAVLAAMRDADVPVMTLASGGGGSGIAGVRVDDEAAAYDLTRVILAKGHRRIGFVGFSLMPSVSLGRRAGFVRALEEAGLEPDRELEWTGRPTFDSGLQAAAHFISLKDPPTAIFTSSDDVAAAIVNYAHRLGLRIPDDLSVAGFDDAPIAKQVWPPLTTIRQPITRMAELAAEGLLEALREGREVPPETILVEYEVVERQSLGERTGDATQSTGRKAPVASA